MGRPSKWRSPTTAIRVPEVAEDLSLLLSQALDLYISTRGNKFDSCNSGRLADCYYAVSKFAYYMGYAPEDAVLFAEVPCQAQAVLSHYRVLENKGGRVLLDHPLGPLSFQEWQVRLFKAVPFDADKFCTKLKSQEAGADRSSASGSRSDAGEPHP